MLALKQLPALQDRENPTTQYTSRITGGPLTILPFSVVPARLQRAKMKLAVLASDSSAYPAVQAFQTYMKDLHGPTNFSTFGGGNGFNDNVLNSISIPDFSTVTLTFTSDTDLANYISADDYPSAARPGIWAAIVFNSLGPVYDYSIRMNNSDATSTSAPPVLTFLTSYFPGPLQGYVTSTPQVRGTPQNSDPLNRLSMPGFTTLQLAVDRWLIQRNVSYTLLDNDAVLALSSQVLNSLGNGLGDRLLADIVVINATDPVRANNLLDSLRLWMRSETFAPQQVDFVPMPVSQYKVSLFFTLVLPTLGTLLVMAYLFPVTRLVRALVLEKEMKIRESMRIMGLSDAAHFLSWITTYAIMFAILAILIAILGKSIFPNSDPAYIFAIFFIFGLSSTTFALLVSVFFTRSRTASVLGGILFFAAYFAFYAVNSATATFPQLLSGSLLAPTALGLAVDVIGTLEGSNIGLTARTWGAAGGTSGTWSASASFGMMFFDTLLYAAIAMYADAVLPAPLRELGVPRPWYFPVTLTYWREVFGCESKTKNKKSSRSFRSVNHAIHHTEGTSGWVTRTVTNILSYVPFGSSLASSKQSLLANDNLSSGTTNVLMDTPNDPSYIEEPDNSLKQKEANDRCVSVKALRKEFDTPDGIKVAVNDIDMTMYEGQIFVLLGHNGAGKTTTISMLTGLIEPTDGLATVFGKDIGIELPEIRKDFGVCPQHDVLWPELTVKEHLELYAAIKGVPVKDVPSTITQALSMVGLTEKVNDRSANLSGGQKRKLSVSIAFMGGSKVIFLDEPTSGMDPYSRRSTWQILQQAREGRVIVLTTHFMDEADILGDRIAIMANGKVKCNGTPMFLKRRFGVGYVLTCVKEHSSGSSTTRDSTLLSMIQNYVPEATIATNVGSEISFRLPLSGANKFPSLLAELDASLSKLGIASYGMQVTSIEDVFLQVAAGIYHNHGLLANIEKDGSSSSTNIVTNPLASTKPRSTSTATASLTSSSSSAVYGTSSDTTGKSSVSSEIAVARAQARIEQSPKDAFVQHFGALLTKRARYSRRDYRAVCCQLLVPIILLCVGLGFIRAFSQTAPPDYRFTTANFNVEGFTAADNDPKYPNYVPVFEFKSSSTTTGNISPNISLITRSFPSTNVSTDGPKLVLSPLQAQALDADDPYNFITSSSYPERDWQRMSSFLLRTKKNYAASKYGAYVWTKDNTIITNQDDSTTVPYDNVATYSAFVNTTARHAGPIFMNLLNSALLRNAQGDPRLTISTRNHPLPLTNIQQRFVLSLQTVAVVQVVLIALAFVPASFIMFVVKERENGAKHQQIVSGVSAPAYWLSNFLYDSFTYLLPAFLTVLVVYSFSVGSLTDSTADHLAGFMLNILLYGPASAAFSYMISHLFKSHSTAQAAIVMINIISFGGVLVMLALINVDSTCADVAPISSALRLIPMFAMGNALTQLSLMDVLPQLQFRCDTSNGIFNPPSTYAPYTSALDMHVSGSGILYLAIEAIVYVILAIIFDVLLSIPRIRQYLDRPPKDSATKGMEPVPNEDEDVKNEAERIYRQTVSSQSLTDVIVLDRIRKMYSNGKVAVRNLSFGVHVGEVFGFLGINGAGKSTSLKMLTGDVLPSSGTAKLAGYDIINEQQQVRRLLGYCPQHDALLDLLTVKEHLELYARIKGVPEKEISYTVDQQLESFDLRSYANKLAGSLSGGNKRKLSVAVALIGNPPIVFLDEPSTGMDPVAKRFMWSVISRVATERKQCSIILTTHSMEEVEALCTRIGIMVGGRLRCLGTAQHLRNRHGQGYVSHMRLVPVTNEAIDTLIGKIIDTLGLNHLNSQEYKQVRVSSSSFNSICVALERPWRARELTSNGSGWNIIATSETSPNHDVSITDFAQWLAEEDQVEAITEYVCETSFPGSVLVERQGLSLKFSIPSINSIASTGKSSTATSLSTMFAILEGSRRLGVETYTLGQTSLEQVFNTFAAQQEEETGIARGFGTAIETRRSAHAAAENHHYQQTDSSSSGSSSRDSTTLIMNNVPDWQGKKQ